MSEEIEIEVEETSAERSPLFGGLRRVLLAGIGAVALAQDEIEAFVDKLVERGELAEADGRTLVEELRERRRRRMHKASDTLEPRVQKMLERMNIPTKRDVEELSDKIANLVEKVEQLAKKK